MPRRADNCSMHCLHTVHPCTKAYRDDNFVWNKIEQLSWPFGRVSWMRLVIYGVIESQCVLLSKNITHVSASSIMNKDCPICRIMRIFIGVFLIMVVVFLLVSQ